MELNQEKRIAISQSNYIPWKGYFDMIASVDEFVLYDDMQYTRRDWRNRNKIKTPAGLIWLTVPVEVKGKYFQAINATRIADQGWAAKHWNSIRANYAKAPCFAELAGWLEALYAEAGRLDLLSDVNRHFLAAICDKLGIDTKLTWSSDYELQEDRTERLLGICKQADAKTYLSGPAAREYLDESPFAASGVGVEWMDYSGYPEYPQLHGDFEHGVTALDLLLNTGDSASDYMKRVAK